MIFKKMSPHDYTRISWPLAIAALVIIVACLAPWLFTRSGSVDFTATGEIGDTIGGTMSPLVGIAWVLMTFVAFLMQVRANEIQSDQLGKSFKLKEKEGKVEDRRACCSKLSTGLNMHKEESIIKEFEGKI